MRKPSYLSPSQLGLFEDEPEKYFLQHLAPHSIRQPQANYMAIGSAFDAFVKINLLKDLGLQAPWTFEELFNAQVEEHNRGWALDNGQYIFNEYQNSGAYADIFDLLARPNANPRMEFKVQGEVKGVQLLGKPDLKFQYDDVSVVWDWKVNGYCSKYPTSPARCYSKLRDSGKIKAHKDFVEINFHGIKIHDGFLEEIKTDWADQLAIYSWLLGNFDNEKTVFCIEQIVAKPCDPKPKLRFASFWCRISKDYQQILVERLRRMWDAINNDHVFLSMNKEESQKKCAMLAEQSVLCRTTDPNLAFIFNK